MIENPDRPILRPAVAGRVPSAIGDAVVASAPLDRRVLRGDCAHDDTGKTVVLVIDPRPLMRETIAHWLEAHAREFRILPLAGPDQPTGRIGRGIGLAVINIGGALLTDHPVRRDLDVLGRTFPDVPVAVLADRAGPSCVAEALRQGVRAYIPTALTPPAMVEALRLALAGGTFVPTLARGAGTEDDRTRDRAAAEVEGLTPRQREVFGLLRQGKPNKIIAYELHMQQSTVKVHVRHIMMKLKATNRTQAVFLANRLIEAARAADARG